MSVNDRTAEIRANLERIQARMERAAQSVGRSPQGVQLVVVTKAQPLAVTRAVVEAGAAILGENYPEEALPKILGMQGSGPNAWHMIGHLQSRKAKIVADHFHMLQSLDSARLAEKLERLLEERGKTLPVLLEVNVGGEESKFGWPARDETEWELLLPEIEQVRKLPHLRIAGLMTMPPLFDDPEQSRPYFVRMRALQEYLLRQLPDVDLRQLSMGTSVDFETAIAEGSTLVRIGTAIVGPRPVRTI